MKEFIIQNMEVVISFVSIVVTLILGKVIKNHTGISNKLIPLQNAIIMIICVGIYYFATGDMSAVIAAGSPVATLIYDVFHNIKAYNLAKLNDFENDEFYNSRMDDNLLAERDDE